MKRVLAITVLSALLVAGGIFVFAGVSHAADATSGTATTWLGRCGQFIDSVATSLGLDRLTIMTRRHNGESLSAIAASQGVTEQQLVDQLKAERVAQINGLVAAGSITQAQADAYIANLDNTIKAGVERTTIGPAGGRGFGMMGGGRGVGGGCGGSGWGRAAANQSNATQGTR